MMTMTIRLQQCLVCLCCLYVQNSQCQYVSFQRGQEKPNLCDNPSNNSLVEYFFNFIFAEFHNNPPVCVCVQMCLDQPTFCYPNGCLKRPENKKNPEEVPAQVSNVQSNKLNAMSFMVNDHSNFMSDYLGKKTAIDSNVAVNSDTHQIKDFASDPFKDRYKTLFKYKKMPKVHLRYNLREQVKNKMDSVRVEAIDISKTRWPVNKHLRSNDNRRILLDNKFREKVDSENPKFFPTLSSEEERAQFQFQFKRDLRNKSDFVKKAKILDEAEDITENPSFSLENLIENLIVSSFGPLTNDTELDLNINVDYTTNNITTPEPITFPNKRSIFSGNTTIIINETTVMSMNLTNENLNQNKYIDDSSGNELNNKFNEMIESMSKNIDKRNNSSIEILEQYIGKRLDVSEENTSNRTDINVSITDVITTTSKSTPPTIEITEITTKTKNRQRITRKQNSKVN